MSNAPQAPRPLTLPDLLDLKVVGDPQLSADGSRLAWVVAEANKTDTPKPRSRVWTMVLEGGEPRAFTAEYRTDAAPRWSPDGGMLAFVSDRRDAGKPWLYAIPIGGPECTGGEAELLWDSPGDVSQPRWSPDGRRIACLMTDADTAEQRARKERKDDPRVADSDWRFDRLWVVDVATRQAHCATGERVHVWEYDWSPDGQRLVALVSDHPGDDAWFHAELVTVPAAGGNSDPLCTTRKQYALPRWSPDGRQIAFLSSTWSDPGVVGGDIWVVDAPCGEPRNLTAESGVSASFLAWEPGSAGILFLGYGEGKLTLGRLAVAAGTMERFWTEPITAA